MAIKEAAKLEGKQELLDYLIRIAMATQASEVWRALFAEMRVNASNDLEIYLDELEEPEEPTS